MEGSTKKVDPDHRYYINTIRNTMREPKVGFTRQHLEYLDKQFPELTDETDVNKLLVNSGKRAVVKYIEQLVTTNAKPVLE
jgi:hypothetical protein